MEQVSKNSVSKANKSSTTDFCLSILELFTVEKAQWGIREIANATGKSPATVQRAVNTLAKHCLLDKSPSHKGYTLGVRCIGLGYIAEHHINFKQRMNYYLEPLLSFTKHTVFFYSYRNDFATCLYVSENDPMASHRVTLGHQLRLHEAPVSQIILAFMSPENQGEYLAKYNSSQEAKLLEEQLQQFKSDGFAYSKDIIFKGTHSLSVPIFDLDNMPVGSLCVASHYSEEHQRFEPELKLLRTTANILKGKV